jgi:FkbM family methyltransferase
MGLLRTVLERVSRNRILKRRLPANLGNGIIFVSPDAALSFWKPRLTSDLFDFAREFVKPGDTVWDIGANVGLFSRAAAYCAGSSGKVIAIEADMWLVSLLRRTSAAVDPSAAPIEVLPVAIFDQCGIASFNIAKRGRASNFLASEAGQSQTGGIRETVQVMTISLDWLLQQGSRPAVVKVDVEGAELDVFRGAERLLSDVRPVILCEVQDAARDGITALFKRHRYDFYDWDSHPRVSTARAAYNMLAIPAKPAS